jgi:hypothetical protein
MRQIISPINPANYTRHISPPAFLLQSVKAFANAVCKAASATVVIDKNLNLVQVHHALTGKGTSGGSLKRMNDTFSPQCKGVCMMSCRKPMLYVGMY